MASGTCNAVATNAHAEVHIINADSEGKMCLTEDAAELMFMEASTNRNVMIDTTTANGAQLVTQISGGGTFPLENVPGALCWSLPTNAFCCYVPKESCIEASGQQLSEAERDHFEALHGREFMRSRLPCTNCPGGGAVIGAAACKDSCYPCDLGCLQVNMGRDVFYKNVGFAQAGE